MTRGPVPVKADRAPGGGLQVLKFGGNTLDDPAALARAAGEVGKVAPAVVVVSASRASSDLLLGAARLALDGQVGDARKMARHFGEHWMSRIREGIPSSSEAGRLSARVDEQVQRALAVCEGVRTLRELSERTFNTLWAIAQRTAAEFLSALARQHQVRTEVVDPTNVLFAERRHDTVWPDFAKCARGASSVIGPRLAEQVTVVVPGGIAAGTAGDAVSLDPGGSDFSATILARSLKAASVTLFKDFDGLPTADPALVPNARIIPELHYREASELGYYGGKWLHPRTLIPLVEPQIPLFVRNVRSDSPGTRIAGDVEAGSYPVKALTAFVGQAMLAVEGNGMLGVPGIAARTFAALSQAGHSVSMISQASSESSICLVVPELEAEHARTALQEAFATELEQRLIDGIRLQKKLAVVAVVGLGMRGRPGIAARTFGALSKNRINVLAIAQGSSELNITVALNEDDAPAALGALHQEYRLDRLRPLGESEGRECNLVLLGFGQIGRALADQMSKQSKYFTEQLALNIKPVAILDRAGIQLNEGGYGPEALRKLIRAKASRKKQSRPSKAWTPKHSLEVLRKQVWPLPLHRPVLIDLTAEETAPLLIEALEHGFHVVTANKKPLAIAQADFDRMMELAHERGLSVRYEATVGAGLPVLDTLSKLREAGDPVRNIQGCLSGTLGYLMTQLEQGVPFSKAVSTAYSLGYTEPDPREDLSGMDVARKALILARTLGHRLEMAEIDVKPLFPKRLSSSNPKQFIKSLKALDPEYSEQHQKARKENMVLRYVAQISAEGVEVGMQAVEASSPLARLHGTDNEVVIHTERYSKRPLVVTGPGAGADVTAAGVLNDIIAIASHSERTDSRRSKAQTIR